MHLGYSAAAYRLAILRIPEARFGWAVLLVPLLLLATASFSLSLTRPALVVYTILLAVPYIVLPLLSAFVGSWSTAVPETLRLLAARFIDNVGLLFPKVEPLVVWPKLWVPAADRPPYPAWGWEVLHQISAVALWVVIGLWAYRR